jgi:hypothetical protein
MKGLTNGKPYGPMSFPAAAARGHLYSFENKFRFKKMGNYKQKIHKNTVLSMS